MSQFLSDIEIAQATHLQPIEVIAQKLDIPKASLEHYGNFKAKVDVFSDYFAKKHVQSSSKLVLAKQRFLLVWQMRLRAKIHELHSVCVSLP